MSSQRCVVQFNLGFGFVRRAGCGSKFFLLGLNEALSNRTNSFAAL